MTRQTVAVYGLDPNPLGITWHWTPSDDIDLDAFYEPVSGQGIAKRAPSRWVHQAPTSPSDNPDGRWFWSADNSAAEFKAIDLPDEPTELLDDGWSLMRNSRVEEVVFGRYVIAAARFLAVDNDIRRSA